MKKWMALLLAFALVFSLTGCDLVETVTDTVSDVAGGLLDTVSGLFGPKVDEALLGRYDGALISMDGELVTFADAYGSDENYIELRKGGKCVVVLAGESIETKWTLDGTSISIALQDDFSPGTLEDGLLTLEFFGAELIFNKEGTTAPTIPTEPPIPDDPNSITLGNAEAVYLYSKVVTDSDQDKAIAMYFDFSHTGESAASFGWSFYTTVKQGETELMTSVVWLDRETYAAMDDSVYTEVAPGEHLEVCLTYTLVDLTTPVVLECVDFNSDTTDTLTIDMATVEIPTVAGYYTLNSFVLADGTTMDKASLATIGFTETTFIVLAEDGTGRICMNRDEYDLTYTDTQITADGDAVDYYLDENGLLVVDINGMLFRFEPSDGTPPEPGSLDITSPLADTYGGDWFGTLTVYDAVGFYEEDIDVNLECLARLIFHKDGTCTLFLTIGMDQDFEEITVSYSDDGTYLIPSGYMLTMPITDDSFVLVEDGIMYVDLYSSDSEDWVNLYAMLRPFGDFSWNAETDYPCMSQESIDYYSGMTFEEIMTDWGEDPSEAPVA